MATTATVDFASMGDENFFKTTPLHGFLNLDQSNALCKRLFWIFCLLAALAVCTYQVTQLVIEYYSYKLTTEVFVRPFTSAPFPDLVLCTFSKYNLSKRMELDIDHNPNYTTNLFDYIRNFTELELADLEDFFSSVNQSTMQRLLHDIERFQQAVGFPQFRNLVGYMGSDCNRFIQKCTLQTQADNGGYHMRTWQCCDLVAPMVRRSDGVCFMIKGSKWRNALKGHGLPHMIRLKLKPPLLKNRGALAFAYYNWDVRSAFTRVHARSGHLVRVELQLKKTKTVSTPKLQCQMDSELTCDGCFAQCERDAMLDKCGCLPIKYVSHLNDGKICEPRDLYHCVSQNLTHQDKIQIDNCRKSCPEPCTVWQLDKDTTYTPVFKDIEGTQLDDTFAEVQFAYTPYGYTEMIQTYAMTLETLMGSVGGLFGLWFGGSILALVHLIWSFSQLAKDLQQKKLRSLRLGERLTPGMRRMYLTRQCRANTIADL